MDNLLNLSRVGLHSGLVFCIAKNSLEEGACLSGELLLILFENHRLDM